MAKERIQDAAPEVIEEQPIEKVNQDWMDDLQVCLTSLTRIPIPGGLVISNPSLAQATRFFPVIGALIGLIGVIVVTVSDVLGLPFGASILIALLSLSFITGGVHEDGLADTADAIAGRVNGLEQQLESTRDRRVSTVGVLSLIFAVALKWAALTTLSVSGAAVALFTMAVVSRGALPIYMRYMIPAERDGISTSAERPEFDRATISVILTLIVSFFTVGFWPTISIIIVLVVVTGAAVWGLKRLFSNHTGDVFGALQQISEICVILTIATLGL